MYGLFIGRGYRNSTPYFMQSFGWNSDRFLNWIILNVHKHYSSTGQHMPLFLNIGRGRVLNDNYETDETITFILLKTNKNNKDYSKHQWYKENFFFIKSHKPTITLCDKMICSFRHYYLYHYILDNIIWIYVSYTFLIVTCTHISSPSQHCHIFRSIM